MLYHGFSIDEVPGDYKVSFKGQFLTSFHTEFGAKDWIDSHYGLEIVEQNEYFFVWKDEGEEYGYMAEYKVGSNAGKYSDWFDDLEDSINDGWNETKAETKLDFSTDEYEISWDNDAKAFKAKLNATGEIVSSDAFDPWNAANDAKAKAYEYTSNAQKVSASEESGESVEVLDKYDKYSVVKKGDEYLVVNTDAETVIIGVDTPEKAGMHAYYLDIGAAVEKDYKWEDHHGEKISIGSPSVDSGNEATKHAEAWSVTDVKDYGDYATFKDTNGKYGYYVKSTGEAVAGYKTNATAKTGAERARTRAAKIQLGELGIDAGTNATETLHLHYSQKVRDTFAYAEKQMQATLDEKLARYERGLVAMQGKLERGEITGEQFELWRKQQTESQRYMQETVDQLARIMVESDQVAVSMLNHETPKVFAENYNFATYKLEHDTRMDLSFKLMDPETVKLMIMDDPDLLPPRKIDVGKDMAWHKKQLNAQITQGLLLGENLDKIAKRIQRVNGKGMYSCLGAARTMMTSAQNAGRQSALERAQDMGIDLMKEWLATPDDRTRPSHRHADGEKVPLDERFSNGCMFPGDPTAPSKEVWGCRCTLIGAVTGVDDEGERWMNLPEEMTYEEWKAGKTAADQEREKELQAEYDERQERIAALSKSSSDLMKETYHVRGRAVNVADYESIAEEVETQIGIAERWLGLHEGMQDDNRWRSKKRELDKLNRYKEASAEYSRLQKELGPLIERQNEVKERLDALKAKFLPQFNYSQAAKDAAHRFTPEDADDFLRPTCSKVWLCASDDERYAAWDYTYGSGRYNRPLSGYDNSWSQSAYKGPGNVPLDVNHHGGHIRDLTNMIERSSYTENCWYPRGISSSQFEQMYGLSQDSLSRMADADLQALVGQRGTNYAFASCGIAKGKEFYSKDVVAEIYVPAGTECLYMEPFSHYNPMSPNGPNWDGVSPAPTHGATGKKELGSEAEILLQRGLTYQITDIERRGMKVYVKMEAHPELGYEKYDQQFV